MLQTIREDGDWGHWLAFFLRGISEVSAQAAETARRILKQREDDRNRIVDALGRAAGSGHRVLRHLYEKPIESVNYIRDLHNVTYPVANQLVDRLVSIGILEEITGQSRNRQFRYATYIDLFVDGGKSDHG